MGSINLLLCTVKTTEQGSSYFDVITLNRTYHFLSNTKEEMTSWLNHIRTASEKIYSNVILSKMELPKSSQLRANGMQPEENLFRILAFQKLSNSCADCSSPNPNWASINNGIFICIECAGIHRSLGVHISIVRSIELVRWDESEIQVSQYKVILPRLYY